MFFKSSSRASIVSVAISILIMGLKFYTYSVTSSNAVMSDALESIVNVVVALIAFWVIRFAMAPADSDHPYGHGKAEYFSASFEGGLITFAGLITIIEAIKSFYLPTSLARLDWGLALTLIAGLGNLALGLYLKKVGKYCYSEALLASGEHVLSDVWSTAAAMVGLGIIYLGGSSWIDPLIALVIGLFLVKSGLKIVRKSFGGLLDEADPGVLEKLDSAFKAVRGPEIIDIQQVRVIRSGAYHHIDAYLVMPSFLTLNQISVAKSEFQKRVLSNYLFSGEFHFQVEPCTGNYCQNCLMDHCLIRQSPYLPRTNG